MKNKSFLLFTVLFLLTCVSAVFGQATCPLNSLKPKKISSIDTFNQIPVLNQGRIKPVETYAKGFLLQLSGRTRVEKESAGVWFARFMFAPRTTFSDKIFLINHPEIVEALKLEPEKRRRYSYSQLEAQYDKLQELAVAAEGIDEKKQSLVEKELVRLYNNVRVYLRLSGAFAFAFPHPDFTITDVQVKKMLGLPEQETQFSFYDMLTQTKQLEQATAPLKFKNKDTWTDTDRILARVVNAMAFWMEHYAECPFGFIPTVSVTDEEWMSPMDTILGGFQNPSYRAEITHIRDMMQAYWNGKQLQFDIAARAFMASVEQRASLREQQSIRKIPLERLYNRLNPFGLAKGLYLVALLLALAALLTEGRRLYGLSMAIMFLGIIPHTIAIVLRMLITARPPVTNLFETFVFVGLIGAALGLILELINKNKLGLIVSGLCGVVFLFVAGKFGGDGDTMQMLVAVLDSNFWLSTHVISISIGYAGCCVAGVMGHIYIIQALRNPNSQPQLEVTYKNMLGILGFGLTLTFLGTTLGGIWADQSWGRFWGWDPKENGALLIVLWCAIIFHAKIAKLIHPLGVAVSCIIGLLVVVWAWLGVNLLSVGLHSYGFTSGMANSLAAYVIAELIFIGVSVPLLGRKGFRF